VSEKSTTKVDLKTNKLSILRFSALGFGFAFVEKTLCHFTINLLTFAWADDGGHQVIYPFSLFVLYFDVLQPKFNTNTTSGIHCLPNFIFYWKRRETPSPCGWSRLLAADLGDWALGIGESSPVPHALFPMPYKLEIFLIESPYYHSHITWLLSRWSVTIRPIASISARSVGESCTAAALALSMAC
jgi:hypothetical protein